MKCPKCQAENREGIKFCEECGTKIELKCPKCGAEILLGKKFCGECGHDLTIPSKPVPKDLSFDEKLAKIQRYLPKDLTQKILAQRDRIEGERKQVTVMFCDMEGYTSLTEKLGSEQMYSIMDDVYEILIHKVHDYEGTVNELTGDGVMALFGAPIALEDAPQRAIRSALAIHREINKFSDQFKSESRMPPIRMRIGIHTGPVIVGTLGNDLRVEFKAVGDTVNLASRMEGLADPGTTYVTEDTFKLTEGFFRFEALGEKKVKGKEEPVKVYQVIAPSTRRTRFDVSAERGLTPLVGRERELELLLDGFERVKAGKGQAFSIISEAGIGKSRLLYEFRKAVANEDVTFLEGRCLSYSRGVSYHPIIDVLKSIFEIQEGEGDQEIREKVKNGLRLMGAGEASTPPYLLELLSVKDSGIDQTPMSPEARKDRIIETCRKVVLRGSEVRPLIMAFEDLHWLDKSSEDVLRNHLESIPGSRVLLIFTYRPEFVHTWGAKSYHNQLTLHRLSNRESLEMVTHILGTREIERTLEELILEKTEGVPFFIEEFIKSLKDLKIIEKENNKYHLTKDINQLTIPSTIQDVIMARVDSLPEGAKEVLQTGSVIEREFSYPLIKHIMGLPEQELISRLSVLKDTELLYERGIFPRSTYVFRHGLTQEVVYGSLLLKKRTEIHQKVGEAIESLYSERLEEFYEKLAYHYSKTEIVEKAIKYWQLAGGKALKLYVVNQAIDYLMRALEKIEELPAGDIQKDLKLEVGTKLGFTYLLRNMFPRALEIVRPLEKLAAEKKHLRSLGRIYTIIGIYLVLYELDGQNGIEYLQKSIELSKQIGDIPALSFGSTYLAASYHLFGNLEAAKMKQAELIPVLERKQSWYTLSVPYFILSSIYCDMADAAGAEKWSQESFKCIEKLDDPHTQSWGNLAIGNFYLEQGKFEEAKRRLTKALDHSRAVSLHVAIEMCLTCLIKLHLREREFNASVDYTHELHDLIEHKGGPLTFLGPCLGLEAEVYLQTMKLDKALECLEKALKYKVPASEGYLYRVFGDYHREVVLDNLQSSIEWYHKALQVHDRIGMRLELARDFFSYGEMLKRKGAQNEAEKYFDKALVTFRDFGAAWDIHQVDKAMKGV